MGSTRHTDGTRGVPALRAAGQALRNPLLLASVFTLGWLLSDVHSVLGRIDLLRDLPFADLARAERAGVREDWWVLFLAAPIRFAGILVWCGNAFGGRFSSTRPGVRVLLMFTGAAAFVTAEPALRWGWRLLHP